MKENKKTIFAVFALMLVGIIVSAGVSAFGFGWMQEDKEDIREAVEDNDFDGWREAIQARLTEENFNEMVSRYQSRFACGESRELVREAIETEDYEAYVDAVSSYEGCPVEMAELTESDFDILIQIHEARMEGDVETVQELREELDVEMPFGNGQMMMRKGMGQMQRGMRNIGQGLRMHNAQKITE